MAKIIEFYIPKTFQKKPAPPSPRGQVIQFYRRRKIA